MVSQQICQCQFIYTEHLKHQNAAANVLYIKSYIEHKINWKNINKWIIDQFDNWQAANVKKLVLEKQKQTFLPQPKNKQLHSRLTAAWVSGICRSQNASCSDQAVKDKRVAVPRSLQDKERLDLCQKMKLEKTKQEYRVNFFLKPAHPFYFDSEQENCHPSHPRQLCNWFIVELHMGK